jgi:hypothetical protein
VELSFQDAINAARFLLGAQLAIVIRFTPAAELGAFTMLPWGISATLKRTLRRKATLSLEKQFFAFAPA